MKHFFPLALLLLAACASGPDRSDYRGVRLKPAANPSAVIAAEIGFAQLAQTKGQWTAFRATATDDAVMFMPGPTRAQAWLKGRADPAVAVRWQPHQVWSSCDGSLAVTRGAWQGPNASGFFTTIWQRQKDGGYKWVLDQGDALDMALPVPEMINAGVADCGGKDAIAVARGAWLDTLPARGGGGSDDGTLVFEWTAAADQAHTLTVTMMKGGKMTEVVAQTVAAPKP